MNKNLLELLDQINAKKAEVQNLVNEDKIEEAKTAKTELKTLQDKFDLLKDIEDQAPAEAPQVMIPVEDHKDSVHEFADAARHRFQNIAQEGQGTDGGYTVPEDIQTQIREFRDASFSLRDLVSVENVTTNKGARIYKTKEHATPFRQIAEGGAIPQGTDMQFARVAYEIKKYGAFFPMTNELFADSDANITGALTRWIGQGAQATDNFEVGKVLRGKTPTDITKLDEIKLAIDKILGSAYKGLSTLVTNDNGWYLLDILKDSDKDYVFYRDPTDPSKMRLGVGGNTIPLQVVPNNVLGDSHTDVFVATAQQTSFTLSVKPKATTGSITAATSNGVSIASVISYSGTTVTYSGAGFIGGEIIVITYDVGTPFIIGDFKDALTIFDRQRISIMASNVAIAGNYNAFQNDETLFRALLREDFKSVDTDAWVHLRNVTGSMTID